MILYLQQFIYQQLNKKQITDKLVGIYYQVPANSIFPYIYIGDFHSKDISTKDREILDISFRLNIYLRDKNLKSMLELAEEIKETLKDNETMMMRCFEEKVILQTDGITQQIVMLFKVKFVGRIILHP